MKIRSIQLINFRKFVGSVRVADIGDGVNVLVGRNELGKSTLLEAINAVIFEKAKSTSQHVKSFRHFVNGTVPEVKLTFEVEGKTWCIHKRFAGQAGKATLTCSDKRVFGDEAAESELQRLLGFTGGRGGGEPGIWGTLWVRQGHSFGDTTLDEEARRTVQGCLEAQVGAVTGGTRGYKIPKAVREALEEICGTRGPRGKFKDAIDRLEEVRKNIAELGAKRSNLFKQMDDLARAKHELQEIQSGWDEDSHHAELEVERGKRTAAATRAAEVESAKSAANLASERAAHVQQVIEDRRKLLEELREIESAIDILKPQIAEALAAKTNAQSSVQAVENTLADLRNKASQNGARSRYLETVRGAVALDDEIKEHQATLNKASSLERQIGRILEDIGQIAATDEAVLRIEEATTEMSAADSAINAVATTVSFEIEKQAHRRVLIDEKPLNAPSISLPIIGKVVISIEEVGIIAVEPQIRNRNVLLVRQREAMEGLKAALDAAGVKDLSAARVAAAQRKEHERRLAEVRREISGLAPGNRSKKMAAGLDAVRNRISELTGRLTAETKKLALPALPKSIDIENQIQKNHAQGAQLLADIESNEAALVGPKELLNQADRKLQKVQERMVDLTAAFATKKAVLDAGRANTSDEQLATNAQTLDREATERNSRLVELERNQGESPQAIDARIKRLESAATNHQIAVGELGNTIIRLKTLIEANEGAGIEEIIAASEAERSYLTDKVAEFEQDSAVLQLLSGTLETAEQEAKNRYLLPVITRVEPYLKMLIPGADLVVNEDLHITAIKRDGIQEEFGCLSDGTQEQLAILARIGFAELLLSRGRPATVILDDALAFSDDQRIESMFDILMRAGAELQIIVLTCRKRLFTRLGAATLRIEEDYLSP